MEKLISFHGDVNIKNQLVANLTAHAKADEIIQGTYWSDGKGCAVGCSIVDFGGIPEDHSEYERLFGIPRAIAMLEDGIFEGLSVDDSGWWPQAFAEAVPVGADLSMVLPKFFVWLLGDEKDGVIRHASEEGRKVIQGVIDLYQRKIAGEEIEIEYWRSARRAATAAAATTATATTAAAAAAAAAAATAATAATADAYAATTATATTADAYAATAATAATATAVRRESRKKQALKLIEIIASCKATT